MFKKAYITRMLYVIISVELLINSTVYGIELPTEPYLRVPIAPDTYVRIKNTCKYFSGNFIISTDLSSEQILLWDGKGNGLIPIFPKQVYNIGFCFDPAEKEIFFLPGNIARRLIQILSNQPNTLCYDCLTFIHFLFDVKFDLANWEDNWKFIDFDEKMEDKLIPGQPIAIFSNNGISNTYYHAALYVGKSKYISISNIEGPLMLMDLLSMKKKFGGDKLCLLQSKKIQTISKDTVTSL